MKISYIAGAVAAGIVATTCAGVGANAAFPWVDITPVSAACKNVTEAGNDLSVTVKNIGSVATHDVYVYYQVTGVHTYEQRVNLKYPYEVIQPGQSRGAWIGRYQLSGPVQIKVRLVSSNSDSNTANNSGTFTVECPALPPS